MTTIRNTARGAQRNAHRHGALSKVTAIVRASVLEKVEQRLRDLRVPGISVTRVKGYGEYKNFYTRDLLDEHARIEIFLPADQTDDIARAIVEVARTGYPGDGIVVVLPVESIYHVRTGERVTADEFPKE
jgi:nitrogen regulatory protein P-II 1